MAKTAPERPDTVTHQQRPTSIPLAAWGAVVAGYASIAWMAILEPENASIGVEWGGWSSFLFGVALSVGVLLGVRALWTIEAALSALGIVVVGVGAVNDPSAHAIGGAVLMAVSLVLLLLPSVQHYATGRLRVFVERDTGRGLIYSAMPRLLVAFVSLLSVVWLLLPEHLR